MEAATQTKFHIRWMIPRDYPDVLRIENESWGKPWDEVQLALCLRQRNIIGMVVERGEQVVGYMIYELHSRSIRVLSITVDPAWRRQGIGLQIVERLASKLSPHRRKLLRVDVSERDLGTHLFLRETGFRAVNILRDWTDDGDGGIRFVREVTP